jgi:hypothetical protein
VEQVPASGTLYLMDTVGSMSEVRVVVYLGGGGNCARENWALRMVKARASSWNGYDECQFVISRNWCNGWGVQGCPTQLTMLLEAHVFAASWRGNEVYGSLKLVPPWNCA